MRVLFGSIAFLCALHLQAALAEIAFPSPNPDSGTVSIISDGITEPDSLASRILNDISVTLDKESDIRVLSISGYGGAINVRDLLLLRGADMAVLNNDVLAYLDLAKVLPEGRKHIRLVTPLFSEGVVLLARQGVKSVADLKGKKVGVPGSTIARDVTARTIFGLLKIDAEVVALDEKELSRRAAADLSAVLVYEKDLRGLLAYGIGPQTYHVVPLPPSGPLAQVYLRRMLSKNALQNFSQGGDVETVDVTTVLASFDWTPKQGRYVNVSAFVEQLFAKLPRLRERYPRSPFSATDVRLDLPGWKRFAPAQALAAAAAEPPSPPVAPAAAPLDPLRSTAAPLRIAVVARPPLSDPRQGDGGVVLKLLEAALTSSGTAVSIAWADGERALLDSLITAKTADIALFWQTPRCDSPQGLSSMDASLCDNAELSGPLMQVTLGVFSRLDATLAAGQDAAAQDAGRENSQPGERILCVPESHPVPEAVFTSIPWAKAQIVKTMHPKTLIDCISAVEQRQADALIAVEPEARFVIEKLKLGNVLQLSQRPLIPVSLHALVSKENPRREELLDRNGKAIASFKQSGRYAEVLNAHMSDLTGQDTAGTQPPLAAGISVAAGVVR